MKIAGFVIDEVEEMFDRIDVDGDGSISFEEFSGLLRDIKHAQPDSEIRASFNAIDTNRDGRVSFDELCAWATR